MQVTDNSMLSTFLECPRKYYYIYRLRLTDPNKSLSAAIDMGSAFHAAAEETELEKALDAFTVEWNKTIKMTKKPYTLENGLALVKWYWRQPKHSVPWLKEIGFVVPLDNLLYGGKIDIIEHHEYFGLAITDYKTTKNMSTCYVEQAVNSKQIKGYVASAHILGYEPKIGIIRVVTIVPPYTMTDIPVQCTEQDIDSWIQSVEQQGRWLNECEAKNFYSCSGKCGNAWESCSFLKLCLSGNGKQYNLEDCLSLGYIIAPKWEPWYSGKITVLDQPSLSIL